MHKRFCIASIKVKDSIRRSSSELLFIVLVCFACQPSHQQHTAPKPKALFIIVDGIPADVIEKLELPVLSEIAQVGGYTRAYTGGLAAGYSKTPTISAVGYNSLLTGTWANKHNVWDNDIADPNYNYWNIFRIAEASDPDLTTAIFSTWLDNRTKLIGEGLLAAGSIKLDLKYDSLEYDTVRFPHNADRKFIQQIDEAVADAAAKVVAENAPDLTWVYLEFTDDMGHMYGDSPQYYDAIRAADVQIGKIWQAIKAREKNYKEDWLIVITTDHGRDTETGKHHGGQSDRERLTWITTNSKKLNQHFKETPAMVDIMPSMASHLNLAIPEAIQKESDGVPFIGAVDISALKASREAEEILIEWKLMNPTLDSLDVFIATTNNFSTGSTDEYKKVKTVAADELNFRFKPEVESPFYKVLVKSPTQYLNAWVVESL
ncbi:MAG: sulfatase-like hydrolase/transferase [Cyclobacteriaceae bacterium]|nr:MAG: sulfatase-like hydrolase/transferase [Cyclobacteriaceae bacterium]